VAAVGPSGWRSGCACRWRPGRPGFCRAAQVLPWEGCSSARAAGWGAALRPESGAVARRLSPPLCFRSPSAWARSKAGGEPLGRALSGPSAPHPGCRGCRPLVAWGLSELTVAARLEPWLQLVPGQQQSVSTERKSGLCSLSCVLTSRV